MQLLVALLPLCRAREWTAWCCGWTVTRKEKTSVLRQVFPLPVSLFSSVILVFISLHLVCVQVMAEVEPVMRPPRHTSVQVVQVYVCVVCLAVLLLVIWTEWNLWWSLFTFPLDGVSREVLVYHRGSCSEGIWVSGAARLE